MSSLAITTNEKDMISVMKNTQNYPNVIVQHLAVGDIAIFDENGIPKCLIERKTVADLLNSFSTGRYADQRKRMIGVREENPNCQLVYLIEGNVGDEYINQVTGCINNLQYYYNIQVISTYNIQDSVNRIKYYWNRYNSNSKERTQLPPMVKSMKLKPADLLTPENYPIHALAIIPGISIKKAKAICEIYPSIELILQELKSFEVKNISQIKVDGRCVGKKSSINICTFVLGNSNKRQKTVEADEDDDIIDLTI